MLSQLCRSCFSPAYRVLSDRVNSYLCLNYDNCPDFRTLVSESETIRVAYPPAPDHPSLERDYPLWPLEAVNRPSHATNRNSVTQSSPEQFTQQGSTAIPTTQGPDPSADHPEPSNAQRSPMLLKQLLSELKNTEGSDPIAEVTKFANRSVDRRRLEARVAGKVKRPTNPFIFYRMASRGAMPDAVGKSWAMESDQIKQCFFALAKIDRSLHEQAFPGHKSQRRPNRGRKIPGGPARETRVQK